MDLQAGKIKPLQLASQFQQVAILLNLALDQALIKMQAMKAMALTI
jgi:hypothetical protein